MYHTIWINSARSDTVAVFNRNMRYLLARVNPHKKPLAFACIGSANVVGDNLGPLIGTVLTRHGLSNVYGTMEEPLNALTLPHYMPLLKYLEETCCLIAIDAAIGDNAQCGYLTLTEGALHPGSAFSKDLPTVGHVYITGIFEQLGNTASREFLSIFCRQISAALIISHSAAQTLPKL